jgi:hypothetical protein
MKFPISNFTKISPVGPALIHACKWADGEVHMMKVIGTFHSNAKAPKTCNKKYMFAEAIKSLLYL